MLIRSISLHLCIAIAATILLITPAPSQNPPQLEGDGYQIIFDMKEGHLPAFDGIDQTDDETGYDALDYNIEIRFDPSDNSVSGHVDMLLVVTEDLLAEIDMRLRNNMIIDDLQVNGQTASYSIQSTSDLIIELAQVMNTGDSATVSIEYHGQPVGGNMGALSWSEHLGTPIISSLSQPNGARTWWPCKDYPWDKATARMVWTVPDWMLATGNGMLRSVSTPEPGWKSYEWIEGYAIATYLVAVTATDFVYWQDWYVNAANDSLPLDYYIYPEDSLGSTIDFVDIPEMIAFFASLFGEYPFMEEKYGHVEFIFGGAMEHQTLTSIGAYFVNGWGPQFNNWIYAHELAHMWWGDMLTCETWDDIWLNEGFATYCDALWAGHDGGQTAFNARMEAFRQTYFQSEYGAYGRFPIYDPEYMWGGTVYQKGSWIVHMIRYVLGEETCWDFFAEWRNRYEYDAANTAQLQETLEDFSGDDWDWFFDKWIYMAGFPEYEWGWTFEALGPDSSTISLSIIQTQPDTAQTPLVFTMPIEFGVTTLQGYETHTVWNDQRYQNFSFNVYGVPLSLEFDPDIWILKTASMSGYVAVGEEPAAPTSYELSLSIRPNPANPEALISFTLPKELEITLSVYNLMGQRVAALLDGLQNAGMTQVSWYPALNSSGIYLVRLETPQKHLTEKLTIVK